MPMRAFRTSRSYAGAYVKANLRLWTGILAALSVALLLLLRGDIFGMSGLWGDLLVLSAMILGVLVIMISHEGYKAPEIADDNPTVA
ncbi:hypothetical protein E2C06_35115 [Dankookia rubra]|uniref:Uncharacterized protein n=1 Tax=Dankookia rubra TaxID=1442381 RepID=A0A4V3A962_9PROT|nr:hypothetical protein [Dankookia rubra]TDH57965.1 hypothetical protein E2C06_35115 [Dankookia rubra]